MRHQWLLPLLTIVGAGCELDPPPQPKAEYCVIPDGQAVYTEKTDFYCRLSSSACSYRYSAVYPNSADAWTAFRDGAPPDAIVPAQSERTKTLSLVPFPVVTRTTVDVGYSERWCLSNGLSCKRIGLFVVHLVPDAAQCPTGSKLI